MIFRQRESRSGCPAVRTAVGVDVERMAFLAHVEAERGIEFFRLLDIGHGEIEAIERMNAKLAGATVDWLRQ
jgi:hypothetical protein